MKQTNRPDHLARWATLAALSVLCTATQAGRPLITEDAAVLGQGECEWESFAGRAKAEGVSSDVINTQVGCGLGARSQVAVSYGRGKSEGSKSTLTSVNGKTNLFKTVDDASALTLAWGVVGDKTDGTNSRAVFLNGVFSQQVNDKVLAHLNLGWTQERQAGMKESTTSWSLAGEYNLGGGLEVMAEVVGVEGEKPTVGTGIRFAASKAWSVNASIHTNTSGPRVNTVTAGAKLAF